jgi:glycosyltransferase involved in cell wall biosynthesis
LLPQHRNRVHRAWLTAARVDALGRDADVVHAHDFNTLELGADVASRKGARLVYDSHEFWSGRPRHGRPTPYQRAAELRTERRLGAKADAVITVSYGIAELFRDRFGWSNVTVVRNSFPLPETAPEPPDRPGGAVYAGRIAAYRELETVAAAAPMLQPLRVTLAGPADETYLASYQPGPITVRPTMPLPEAEALITREGLALVTHSNRWVNHRLALPNKLFLAVRAGVPVIATDVDELASCVRAYGIGALYRPGDVAGLVAATRTVMERYDEYVARVRAAAPALSWQSDGAALLGVYEGLDHA